VVAEHPHAMNRARNVFIVKMSLFCQKSVTMDLVLVISVDWYQKVMFQCVEHIILSNNMFALEEVLFFEI
jgi:hypothetical protein